MKSIILDMDGTFVSLYDVPDWLPKLCAHDPSPYMEAAPLVSMNVLARHLNRLSAKGYKLGIVSWGSKSTGNPEADANYLRATRQAKQKWVARHLKSVHFDSIEVVPYGTPKSTVCPFYGEDAILFDDDERNRAEWGEMAFSEKELFEVLRML